MNNKEHRSSTDIIEDAYNHISPRCSRPSSRKLNTKKSELRVVPGGTDHRSNRHNNNKNMEEIQSSEFLAIEPVTLNEDRTIEVWLTWRVLLCLKHDGGPVLYVWNTAEDVCCMFETRRRTCVVCLKHDGGRVLLCLKHNRGRVLLCLKHGGGRVLYVWNTTEDVCCMFETRWRTCVVSLKHDGVAAHPKLQQFIPIDSVLKYSFCFQRTALGRLSKTPCTPYRQPTLCTN